MELTKKALALHRRMVVFKPSLTCSISLGMLLMALLSNLEAHMIIERPARLTPEEYHNQRKLLSEQEAQEAFGADIVLTTNESIVNNHLMELKVDELAKGYINPYNFTPARHFFEVLDQINASPLFQFIREMPKGAVLHAHDTALASTEVIVNVTYFPNLWQRGNISNTHDLEFRFSRTKPTACDGWETVHNIRNRMGATQYDAEIRRLFSLYDADPLHVYRSINDVWDRFSKLFLALEPIVTYKPVWEHYFREALREFREDNVMYLEFRGLLPATLFDCHRMIDGFLLPMCCGIVVRDKNRQVDELGDVTFRTLYDLDGNTYQPEDVVKIYRTITEEFKAANPRFVGTKFIYAPLRFADNETVDQYMRIAERLHHQYGDYVVGFDLVGQEDPGRRLLDFVPQLLNFPSYINFVFHAGETNWHGMPSDENLLDAIMLGTKRIGHGYALLKHPVLAELVKERDICVEINPVSNQVLKLVADYRNHPASILFSTDFPLVVSSDDPSFWCAAPLSHDFYMAFLGMASAHQDLRMLKKLALNSLRYSLMNKQDKAAAEAIFHQSWNDFIDAKVKQILSKS